MKDKLLVFTITAAIPIDFQELCEVETALESLRGVGFAEITDAEVVTGTVETFDPTAKED